MSECLDITASSESDLFALVQIVPSRHVITRIHTLTQLCTHGHTRTRTVTSPPLQPRQFGC